MTRTIELPSNAGDYAGRYRTDDAAAELFASILAAGLAADDGSAVLAFMVAGLESGRIERIEPDDAELCAACKTCDGDGSVEVGACGSRDCTCDGFGGGCTTSEPCPDCPGREEYEPDWDSMREAREEMRAIAEADYE